MQAPSPSDKLVINRDSEVSVKSQLTTQLMIRITSGQYQSGDMLPSIRQLARQLGIHYNSCLAVYQQLETMGLVERIQGSGTRVCNLSQAVSASSITSTSGQTLHYFAETLIQQAVEQGLCLTDVTALIATKWPRQTEENRATPVVYVDKVPDILPLFKAELENHLGQAIQVVALDDLELTAPSKAYTHWITSTYYARPVQALLDNKHIAGKLTVVPTNHAADVREKIAALPVGGLVVVVSVSNVVLQQADAVIQALRGTEVLVSLRLKNELTSTETKKLLSNAQLIIGDSLTHEWLQPYTNRPVACITVIPPDAATTLFS